MISSTSAYSTGKNSTLEVYNPIFTTMYKEGLVSSLFSLAISRNVSGPGGYLALGGLPSISFNQTFTTTPILITSVDGYSNSLDFYTINIDGVTLNGNAVNSSGGSDIQYIVCFHKTYRPLFCIFLTNIELLLTGRLRHDNELLSYKRCQCCE